METDEIWRRKTDEEVLDACRQLADYTEEGQQILKAEVERRQLTASPEPLEDAGSVANAEVSPLPGRGLARLWAGGYSLPVTYWGWGVGGSLVWLFAIAVVSPVPATTPALGLVALLLLLMVIAYQVIVAVSIWRSAGRYKRETDVGRPARAAVAARAAARRGCAYSRVRSPDRHDDLRPDLRPRIR